MNALHLLTDNRRLSYDEYAVIRQGIDEIRTLHVGFREYVETHHLDPEVFLPGNVWREIYDLDTFENWTYDLVNHVKCVSPFSGFDTMMWGRRDTGDVDAAKASRFYATLLEDGVFPPDIDRVLDREFALSTRLEQSRDDLIRVHEELVSQIPEKYVLRCPDRMGEIGIVHNGAIISRDLLDHQSRVNAMAGAGVLRHLEERIAERGRANVLEIGPGGCFVPYGLDRCLGGGLTIFLVDLPKMMVNGYAYLSGVAGVNRTGLVTILTQEPVHTPFVFLPNYLVPMYEDQLPQFDLVYNAISLNEMNARQVAFYLDFIDAHLAPGGVFFLEAGAKYLDYHVDALSAARRRFPNHRCYGERRIEGVNVLGTPNSFFYANGC